jgi:hypothetical protein
MTTTTDGGAYWVGALSGLLAHPDNGAPSGPALDQMRAIIDHVMLDGSSGWRQIAVGSVHAAVGVVERGVNEPHLVVLAPVIKIPADTHAHAQLFRALLELNHERPLGAHFSIHDDVVYAVLTRPVRGLDTKAVGEAIRNVVGLAEGQSDRLSTIPPPPEPTSELVRLAELPEIKMTPREVRVMRSVLSACDQHSRELLRYLLEGWGKAGHIVVVDPKTGTVGMKIQLGPGPRFTLYTLAAVSLASGQRCQRLALSWGGLRESGLFPGEAIDAFQASVAEIVDLQAADNIAHIEIAERFDRTQARALLWSLRSLAQAARPPREEPFIWDPSLPRLGADVGHKTLAGIQAALLACEPRVRLAYVRLIEGWSAVGGLVHCYRPGRIYLRLKTGTDLGGEHPHIFNVAVLTAPRGDNGQAISLAWGLARGPHAYLAHIPEAASRFERVVSRLPGFELKGDTARLLVGDAFQMADAERLLQAMRDLKAAANA